MNEGHWVGQRRRGKDVSGGRKGKSQGPSCTKVHVGL